MHRITLPRPGRLIVPIAAVLLAVLLTGCGDDDDEATPATDVATDTAQDSSGDDAEFEDLTDQDAVVIQARDNTFLSQYVTISAGTEVTFENRGRNDHNVFPVDDGAFEPVDTEDLEPGDEATITFDEPGEYPYYCTLHGTKTAGMVGTIVVE